MLRWAIPWLCWLIVFVSPQLGKAVPSVDTDDAEANVFEDSAQPFEPLRPRNEAEEDRVAASTQFVLGRIQFQRENPQGALRHYQRAYRYDSSAVAVLGDIVRIAFQLERFGEATRYAVIAAEVDPNDPELMCRLAMFLTEQRNFGRAVQLYEKALWLRRDEPVDAQTLLVRLEMGRLYYLTQEFQKSADCFAIVLDGLDEPDRFGVTDQIQRVLLGRADRTYALMAEGFLQAGQLDKALGLFRLANEEQPNAGLLALHEARVFAQQDHHQEALERLETYVQEKSSSAGSQPYELMGQLLIKLGLEEAEAWKQLRERLEGYVENDPENDALALYLARLYRDQSEVEKAAEIYATFVEDKPGVQSLLGLVETRRQQGDADLLLDALGVAVLNLGSLDAMAEIADRIVQDTELVPRLLERATARSEENDGQLGEGVAFALGFLAAAVDRFDESDKYFGLAAVEEAPDTAAVMLSWGLELFLADQYELAIKVFQRGVDESVLPDDDPAFHFYLSGALEMAGKTDEALAAARVGVEKSSGAARFTNRLAWILYHDKRHDEAYSAYEKLIAEFDDDHSTPGIRDTLRSARLVLSNICVVENRLDQAEEWLEQVLDEFPEDVGALNDLGYLYTDRSKHLKRSLKMISIAVEEEPDNAAYRDSLGWALHRLGRHEEALEHLEKATAGDDPDGVILDHLGDLYQALERQEDAMDAWERAATQFEIDKEQEFLDKTRQKIEQGASPDTVDP